MNSRKRRLIVNKSTFAPLSSFALTAILAVAVTSPARATNPLAQINKSISGLWQKNATHQNNAHQARKKATAYKSQAGTLHDKLEKTQQLLLDANETYENYLGQIKQTEANIVETRHRQQIVTARYNHHVELLGQRLSAMQRTDQMGYLEVLLGAHTFSDLSRRVYLFNAILDRDTELQQQLKQDKEELDTLQNTLMSQWQQRNQLVQATQKEKSRIYLANQELEGYWKQLKSSQYEQWAYSEAEQQSSRDITTMIADLSAKRNALIAQYQAQQAAERARRAAQYRAARRPQRKVRVARRVTSYKTVTDKQGKSKQVPVTRVVYEDRMVSDEHALGTLSEDFSESGGDTGSSSGGGWVLPVHGRLSSRYGNRYHPILHRNKLHTGDDLAASAGTPFRAAKGGTVLYAGWKTGYGNTIIIDNGNGTSTLYGHASKLAVSAGQQVKSGQYIGNVGSTGWSTGPHLHFEVRKSGKPVDPMPTLKKAGF